MSNVSLHADHRNVDGKESNPRAMIRLVYTDNTGERVFSYALVSPKAGAALLKKLFWLARVNIPASLEPVHNGQPKVNQPS